MTIAEAKNEIKRTVTIYLSKNQAGQYEVPKERQRPVFLFGAPGVGKTAIMRQIAHEMQIGLVSYTITHHTRQSAIGLPFIVQKEYDGNACSVTEYTLSEIVASVHEARIGQQQKEGILFIDEINCVSETLAPAMLELLQNKKFGPHPIPEGWILVSAGNPLEYNHSARMFDMVTLDRIKMIAIDPDFSSWKSYAYAAMLEETIIYYLELRQDNLFKIEKLVNDLKFTTPRAWEDLSVAMKQYHKHGYEITNELINQYIQFPEIALEFLKYYHLYKTYTKEYPVREIFNGQYESQVNRMRSSPFDEKMAVIEALINSFNRDAKIYNDVIDKDNHLKRIIATLSKTETNSRALILKESIAMLEKRAALPETPYLEKETLLMTTLELSTAAINQDDKLEALRKLQKNNRTKIKNLGRRNRTSLENMIRFLHTCFGEKHEMVALIIGLITSEHFVRFIAHEPVDLFYHFNELLMVDHQNKMLKNEVAHILERHRASS